MQFIPVIVSSYSGYRADEYPKSFEYNGRKIMISAITDRWYQGENDPEFPPSDYFRVESHEGDSYLLKHDLKADMWYIVNPKQDD